MCAEPDTIVAVVTPEKGDYAAHLWNVYKTFYDGMGMEFDFEKTGKSLRLNNGSEVHFGSNIWDEDEIPYHLSECDIVYFPEAAHTKSFEYLINQIPIHIATNTVLVEASGCNRGSFYEGFWFDNSTSMVPDYPSLFVPWYLSKENRIGFISDKGRYEFEDTMNTRLAGIGASFRIPNPGIGYCPYIDKHEAWNPSWQKVVDFWEWEIESENVQWYLQKYLEFNGSIEELRRSYPTFAEEAFV